MRSFLEHVQACCDCKEAGDVFSPCNRGLSLLSSWKTEARIRFDDGNFETDPHRIILSLRYFGKTEEMGVFMNKATTMALLGYISERDSEIGKLSQNQCHHTGKSECERCGAICPVCDHGPGVCL